MSDEPNTTVPTPEPFREVIRIDEGQLHKYLDAVVRDTVEQTLNDLLDAEADRLCNAQRYERSPDRLDTRAGSYTLTGNVRDYAHIGDI
jgi:transposase-like protein